MAAPDNPPDPVVAAIDRAGIPDGKRILVSVSGGPDSVALFDGLHRLAPQHGWTLRIAHVNHRLRGDESDLDEAFVRSLAAIHNVTMDVVRVATGDLAEARRQSVETAAREVRAEFLFDVLGTWPGDLIVTGHTQDDQAETVILRLLRGTGLTGLGGIRNLDRVVRPLLDVSHEEILEVLQARAQGYRLDSSNADPRYRRNLIRTKIIPALENIQPRAAEHLSKTASLLQMDSDFMSRQSEQALDLLRISVSRDAVGFDRTVWRALHPALRGHTLRLLLLRLLASLTDVHESHIARLSAIIQSDERITIQTNQLPHGVALYVEGPRVTFRRGTPPTTNRPAETELPVPGSVGWADGTLSASIQAVDDAAGLERLLSVSGRFHALCDADRVTLPLRVRSRRAGDRVQLPGGGGSKKVQDIMVDNGIPRDRRVEVPVVEDGRHIVWLAGIVVDGRAAATQLTRSILHLRYVPDPI